MRQIKYSFEQWCIDNNRQDFLDRWDYKKNDLKPSEVASKTEKRFWFKCPKGIHESELKKISSLAYGNAHELKCDKCNSFAQHIIDKYGEEHLNMIWHIDNEISPWDISYGNSSKKIIIADNNCPNGKRFDTCNNLLRNRDTKYIPNDDNVKEGKSLGDIHPECIEVWSDKNETTPYDYLCSSTAKIYWKCENGKHNDFLRRIDASKARGFTCPKCGRLGAGMIDLTGQKFGELTVISFDKSINRVPYWNVKCSCGKELSIRGSSLRSGGAKTCGNFSIHYTGENNSTWKGGGRTPTQIERGKKKYTNWRNTIIEKRGAICIITGEVCEKPNLHHIYPFADYEEYRYEEWNAIIIDNKYHNMLIPGSFHNIYGTKNNTPEQLEEYINTKRSELEIEEPFDVYQYMDEIKDRLQRK